jgi:hypothetical protein
MLNTEDEEEEELMNRLDIGISLYWSKTFISVRKIHF